MPGTGAFRCPARSANRSQYFYAFLNGLHMSRGIAMRLAALALLLALLPAALAQAEAPAAGEVLGTDADVVCAIARAEIDGLEKEIQSLRETVVTLEDRLRAQTERDGAEVTGACQGTRVSCIPRSCLLPCHFSAGIKPCLRLSCPTSCV